MTGIQGISLFNSLCNCLPYLEIFRQVFLNSLFSLRFGLFGNKVATIITNAPSPNNLPTAPGMLRFSDRLTSIPTTSAAPIKSAVSANDSPDETAAQLNPTDNEYRTLVELIGLYQTVKILEAEFSLITGDNAKSNNENEFKLG